MVRFYDCLDKTFKKSARIDIREYFQKYKHVKRWYLVSDYCLGDKSKNNVMTFVFVPENKEFSLICEEVDSALTADLKKTSNITESIINLLRKPEFFSISFVLHENHYFKQFEAKSFAHLSQTYENMLDKWIIAQPNKAHYYRDMTKKRRMYRMNCGKKNFSKKLNQHMLMLSFLATYCFCLLYRWHGPVDEITWFSDRDNMTTMENGIVYTLFELQENVLSQRYLNLPHPKVAFGLPDMRPGQKPMWFDSLIKLPDYICGVVADYDSKNNRTSHKKHFDLIEQLVADNNQLIVFEVKDDGIGRRITELDFTVE